MWAEAACLEVVLDRPHVESTGLTPEGVAAALRRWRGVAADDRVTAVCVRGDDYAFALLGAVRHLGISAP